MFKLCELQLWNQSSLKAYKIDDVTYVYEPNSVGKTLFAESIDFVLGASENEVLRKDGMDNISAIGLHIKNNALDLWVKREITNRFYYKHTYKDEYSVVSKETYVEEISKIILPKIEENEQLEVYKTVFSEKPSFRAFSFLNFITESHQGDLKQIFSKGNELKNAVRIKDVMTFFFNYENIQEISRKQRLLRKNQSEYEQLSQKKLKYDYLLEKIKIGFKKLGLKYTGKNESDKETLKKFRNNFNRTLPKISGDLIYLIQASFDLAEEIKQYEFLNFQTKKAKKRKDNDKALLGLLEALITEDSNNAHYLESIVREIKLIESDKAILSLSNYRKAIQEIENEKEKIDSKISVLKSQASKLSFEETNQELSALEQILSDFSDFTDSDRLSELEKINKQLKIEIRELKEQFDEEGIKKFNNALLDLYFNHEIVENVKYVRDDKKSDGFAISFNPLTQRLTVERNEFIEQDEKKKVRISFIPGSLARRTHLQMLVYLLLLKYVKEKFESMRILPILVIDSADQAFQMDNFKYVFPEIKRFAKNTGIQLIFISKEKPKNIENYISIENGFNPFYHN